MVAAKASAEGPGKLKGPNSLRSATEWLLPQLIPIALGAYPAEADAMSPLRRLRRGQSAAFPQDFFPCRVNWQKDSYLVIRESQGSKACRAHESSEFTERG